MLVAQVTGEGALREAIFRHVATEMVMDHAFPRIGVAGSEPFTEGSRGIVSAHRSTNPGGATQLSLSCTGGGESGGAQLRELCAIRKRRSRPPPCHRQRRGGDCPASRGAHWNACS